jgi:hypothetical protein
MRCSDTVRSTQTTVAQQSAAIAAAVQQLDCIGISRDLVRVLVHYLGDYAVILAQRNGCPPDGVAAVQAVLAEACAGSRTREDSAPVAGDAPELNRETLFDTAAAARMLGLDATTVTLHCRAGRLGQKVGRDWVIQKCELEAFRRNRLGES